MVKDFVNSHFRPRQHIGIELVLQLGGEPLLRGVSLVLSKGTVNVKDKWELEGLDKLPGKISGNVPIALAVNGRGILHKPITIQSSDLDSDVSNLTSLFPAVNTEEFYIQRFQNKSIHYLSLARLAVIDSILNEIKEKGGNVITLSLGPFVVEEIAPYIQVSNSRVEENPRAVLAGGFLLQVSKQGLSGIKPSSANILGDDGYKVTIGEDELEQEYLVAYAAAFSGLVGPSDSLSLTAAPIQTNKEEYVQQKLFRAGFITVLTFFFLLLLTNFFVFAHFSEQNIELQASLLENESTLEQVGVLEQTAKEKEEFLSATGLLNSPRLSFYADRLAVTLPSGVRLSQLSFNPVRSKDIREQGKLSFETGTIAVSGSCRNPTDLNSWLRSIKGLEWVEKIEQQNYAYDESNNEGAFNFYIKIKGEK